MVKKPGSASKIKQIVRPTPYIPQWRLWGQRAERGWRWFDRFFDIKPDFTPDSDLFWQPGLDQETNPFVKGAESGEQPTDEIEWPDTDHNRPAPGSERGGGPPKIKQTWPTIDPVPGRPGIPTDIPIPPSWVGYPVKDSNLPYEDRRLPKPPQPWFTSTKWPENPCEQQEILTGIPCLQGAQIQIRTQKTRQFPKGKNYRKSGLRTDAGKKNHFQRRSDSRRFRGRLRQPSTNQPGGMPRSPRRRYNHRRYKRQYSTSLF